jgi:hypothetical protein
VLGVLHSSYVGLSWQHEAQEAWQAASCCTGQRLV